MEILAIIKQGRATIHAVEEKQTMSRFLLVS